MHCSSKRKETLAFRSKLPQDANIIYDVEPAMKPGPEVDMTKEIHTAASVRVLKCKE
jgi:hypothetical protein